MLSSLPIYLAQLKAGNNSEKLKKEIRQLFYSLRRSKNLTKNICKSLVGIFETIFMNTENSKTNESYKFMYQFNGKLNLKTPNNKKIGLVNLGILHLEKHYICIQQQ